MKILFLVSRFPYPLEKGDKLRAFQHIVNMKQSGHEVILVALSDQKVADNSIKNLHSYCTSIHVINMNKFELAINLANAFLRKLPLQVGYFYSVKNQHEIENIIKQTKPEVLYCQLIRTALYVKNIHHIPKVIDYQDAFSKGTEQRTELAPALYKPLFKRELNLVTDFENQSYEWFNEHLIISTQDKNVLTVKDNSSITVLPNGVDTRFFQPSPSTKKFDITFVGNMNYPPNVDASCFLVNEIMPLVWKTIPNATVQLAGASPGKKVCRLASDKVKVTGWVEDIRECYNNSKVFIAPMRIGTGLQNKLLEAMAMQIPCITTTISFKPLGAVEGKEILVGDDASSLASHLITVLKDVDFASNIAIAGFDFVVLNYSMNHSRVMLDKVFEKLKYKAS